MAYQVPTRPRGSGELISEVFSLWSAHVMALWRVNVFAQAPYAVLVSIVPVVTGFAGAQGRFQQLSRTGATPRMSDLAPLMGSEAAYLLIVLLAAFVITPFLTTPLLHATAEIMWGRPTPVGQAYAAARRVYGRLLIQTLVVSLVVVGVTAAGALAILLVGVLLSLVIHQFALLVVIPLVFAGMAALVALALYVNTRYALGPAAVLLEKAGPVDGLVRSARLTRGRFWATFVVQFVAGLPVLAYGIVVGIASSIAGLGGPAAPYILQAIMAGLLLPIVFPVVPVAQVVLYAEYRRREIAAAPPQTGASLG